MSLGIGEENSGSGNNKGPLGIRGAERVPVVYKGGGEVFETPLVAQIAIDRGHAKPMPPSTQS